MLIRAALGLLILPLVPLLLLEALWNKEGAWRAKRLKKRAAEVRRRLRARRASRGP